MATKKQLEPVAPAADKKKALAAALGQIEKQFGKGSVMRLGENTGMNIEHIPTGSIGLDLALGIGGLPRGRIIEIYGPESSGKTTVALHSVAEAQKLGGTADARLGKAGVVRNVDRAHLSIFLRQNQDGFQVVFRAFLNFQCTDLLF